MFFWPHFVPPHFSAFWGSSILGALSRHTRYHSGGKSIMTPYMYIYSLRHFLTTKRGDSGSAGLPEQKCVIIEALNLDTKMSKNWSSTWKTTKIDQKSSKHKNSKIDKIRKTEKVTKPEKWKSEKVTKLKMIKMIKKSVKNRPLPKNPKMSLKWPKSTLCEFRAAWSGVFWVPGGTTGPGFKAEKCPPLF